MRKYSGTQMGFQAALAVTAGVALTAAGYAIPLTGVDGKASAIGSFGSNHYEANHYEVLRVHFAGGKDGDVSQNWGQLYLPQTEAAPHSIPLAVLFHGGSWQATSGVENVEQLARALADRGMAVYSVEYRRVGSGGGWPFTFTDALNAVNFTPTLGLQYPQLAASRALIVGYSAGGQIAAWAAAHSAEPFLGSVAPGAFRPRRVVSISGTLDLAYAANHGSKTVPLLLGGWPDQLPDRYREASPVAQIDPALEVLAFHGDADPVVSPENSVHYIDALNQAGGKGLLRILPGETHTSHLTAGSPALQRLASDIVRFGDNPEAEPFAGL